MDAFGGMPPELWGDAESIKRKQAIAELLVRQGMTPAAPPESKGRFQGRLSPFQGIAQVMNAFAGQQGMAGAEEARKGLSDKYQAGLADAVSKYAQTKAGTPGVTTAENTAQEGTGSFDMSGAAGPATQTTGAVPGDPRKAIMDAMMSQYPQLQRMGQMDQTQLNRTEDRKDTQAFQADQAKLQREQRTADLEARLADSRTTAQERMELQRELAQMQVAARQDMARLAASLKTPPQAPQPRIIQTEQGPMQIGADNKAAPILGQDGKPIKAPAKGAAPLSATAQKELFEADDVANSAANAIGILKSIVTVDPKTKKSQNDVAFGGGMGDLRTKAMGFVPGNYEGENASVDLKNKVTGQALENLKVIFGGMPTEGERKILLEMQGSLDQTPRQRKIIFDRAIELAERRMKLAQGKAKALREGTYFGSGVATNQDGGQWQDLK